MPNPTGVLPSPGYLRRQLERDCAEVRSQEYGSTLGRLHLLSKVQSVDQGMRLGMRVGARQLRTCRPTRPGQLCARQLTSASQRKERYPITSSARTINLAGW